MIEAAYGRRREFAQTLHAGSTRDYLARVVENDKAHCAAVAGIFGQDYWDGERCFGYGGYRYDGRWRPLAEMLAQQYSLAPGDRVLDIGCGKGYLLYELSQVVPGLVVAGLDVSSYAIDNAKPELRNALTLGHARHLPSPTPASTSFCRWGRCTIWASPICGRHLLRSSAYAAEIANT